MKNVTKLAAAAALATAVAGTAAQAAPLTATTNDPFASTQVLENVSPLVIIGGVAVVIAIAATDSSD